MMREVSGKRRSGEEVARGLGVAVWRQIADRLRDEIVAGTWAPATRLPTESELAMRFGVNRHTVRRAIAVLATESLVRADQGRGTFVAERPLPYPIAERTRFAANAAAAARVGRAEILGHTHETAAPRLAERLALPLDAPLHRIEMMNTLDDLPFSVATIWVSAERFPEFPNCCAATGSVTAAFARLGVTDYFRRETRITAVMPDKDDAERLGVDTTRPLIITESVDVDPEGRPISTLRTRFLADRIELIVAS
ncbi:phosphonate metabolism transcriptional regulator PhnF [Segnochrobactrum spirostomi]|nr:phosphonate metabolism transcriptional regulator PhnF [Segnochrobactrum spirostomi]